MVNDVELPSFKHPPVGEVALGVQFEDLDGLDARHVGQIAEAFKPRFPVYTAQGPLNPQIERFDGLPTGVQFGFTMVSPPVFPRLWLMKEDGTQLVQVQRDRLMHNWRRTTPDTTYPRYAALREQFQEDWQLIASVAAGVDDSEVRTTQCEVSYVNLIEQEGPAGQCAYPSDIFSFLGDSSLKAVDSTFENVTYARSSIVTSKNPKAPARGRFYIELGTGVSNATGARVFQLTLTVRGAPQTGGLDGALAFCDFGHEVIVRSFAELTTPKMHAKWERQT